MSLTPCYTGFSIAFFVGTMTNTVNLSIQFLKALISPTGIPGPDGWPAEIFKQCSDSCVYHPSSYVQFV